MAAQKLETMHLSMVTGHNFKNFLYIATNNSKMKFKIVIYNYSRTHTQNIGINGGGEGVQEL